MVEKRGIDESGSHEPPPPAKKPAISLEALEKAKKALQLQKELKEKLKNLPQLADPSKAMAAAAAAKAAQIAAGFGVPVSLPSHILPAPTGPVIASSAGTFRPAPLRLDAAGREVDEKGNVIARPVQVVSSLKVNQAHVAGDRKAESSAHAGAFMSAPLAPEDDPGFDDRMVTKKADRRKKATFDFVQEGTYQKQAENMRLKAHFGDAGKRPLSSLPRGPIGPTANPNLLPIGGDPNLVPIGVRRDASPGADEGDKVETEDAEPAPPAVEWWDRNLLASGSYAEDIGESGVSIKESKVTFYVEHPVPIEPPSEAIAPPPQPLKLTKKELKKLRTQRRQAREKEKQDLIRQGLLEAPKPKVKIANLYRVLGEQAVADPTAMEREARKQMAERQAAHDDRNLSRKLTPAEKREKKLKKLFDDNSTEIITSVYKVSHLDNIKHRLNKFKIQINAKENNLTGVLLISDEFSLVVVEGCGRSIKRYQKLMLRRMDWTAVNENLQDENEDEAMDDGGSEPCKCDLVWQGVVKARAFPKKFKAEIISDATAAKALLESVGVGHYWDVAKTYNPDEAPGVVLS